ncbi:MAG: hypothetical protein ACJ8HJ_10105 [Massilia sp.]
MGYHVAIVRTRGAQALPIAEDEIERAAATLPGWRYDRAERTLHADGRPQLWWADGELWTKNPDDAALGRMIALADALGARVRGDEGETYRSPDDAYPHPDDEDGRRTAAALSDRWHRRERRRWILRGVVVALLAIVAGRRLVLAYW